MANVKQYLVNKFSSMRISIIQGSKLFSSIIGDMGILGRHIKIDMKSESVGHHAATQALVLSVAGVTAIVLIASLIFLILH